MLEAQLSTSFDSPDALRDAVVDAHTAVQLVQFAAHGRFAPLIERATAALCRDAMLAVVLRDMGDRVGPTVLEASHAAALGTARALVGCLALHPAAASPPVDAAIAAVTQLADRLAATATGAELAWS